MSFIVTITGESASISTSLPYSINADHYEVALLTQTITGVPKTKTIVFAADFVERSIFNRGTLPYIYVWSDNKPAMPYYVPCVYCAMDYLNLTLMDENLEKLTKVKKCVVVLHFRKRVDK